VEGREKTDRWRGWRYEGDYSANPRSDSQATARLLNDDTLDHEYLPILGLPEYTAAAGKLILGSESPAISEGRAVSVQTISGTGANHLGALFLSRFYGFNGPAKVYLSNPTWGA
jgi:aspartate aminotransferase